MNTVRFLLANKVENLCGIFKKIFKLQLILWIKVSIEIWGFNSRGFFLDLEIQTTALAVLWVLFELSI